MINLLGEKDEKKLSQDQKAFRETIMKLADDEWYRFRDLAYDYYSAIDKIWGHEYYPFTYRKIGTEEWKTAHQYDRFL